MGRTVEVRYRTTTYVRVDLDSEAVESVVVDAESPRLDYDVLDDTERGTWVLLASSGAVGGKTDLLDLDPVSVVERSFDELGNEIEVFISRNVASRAIQIAENTEWPAWEID